MVAEKRHHPIHHDDVSILSIYCYESVSLLQDLVLELQQRLGEAPPVPPTAAVADAASSERINVTLPRGVMDDLSAMPWMKAAAVEISRLTCWRKRFVVTVPLAD